MLWKYIDIGSRSEKSIYYTFGLFKCENVNGEIIEKPCTKFVIGFKNDIKKIEDKAKVACEKLNKGIINKHIIIYADKKVKINRKSGDIPIGTRSLLYPSFNLSTYIKGHDYV